MVNIFTGVFYTRQNTEWLEIQTCVSKIALAMVSVASVIFIHAYGRVTLLLQVSTKKM